MAEHNITVKLTGKPGLPLLMDNGQTIDPTNEWAVRLRDERAISKRRKTERAQADADEIQFQAAAYSDGEDFPILPIANFLKCMVESARMVKAGKKVESGVYVNSGSRLSFNGNGTGKKAKTIAELAGNPEYTHRAPTGRGVVAVRPMFHDWSCEYEITFDDEIIDRRTLDDILRRAGKVGVGSWKARYGKFDVEVTKA